MGVSAPAFYHRPLMDWSGLHPQPVERMLTVVLRQRDSLTRLVERMRVRRFPAEDPVYRAALGALEKTSNLGGVLAKFREPMPGDDDLMTRKPWGG